MVLLLLRDIFGQDQAITQLRQAQLAGRVPHGLIFSGPNGVGKGTTARALGAWFLCDHPLADDSCGKCPSCHLVEAGTHPDFHLIFRQLVRLLKKTSKARDLSIDVIKEYFLGPASRTPMQGNGKVFVIEEAETMSRDAANAILKTLEEPYGRTLILLLTDQPHYLLPTMRSRCQVVQFSGLSDDLIMGQLEAKGIDRATAELAAHLAQGSLGPAIRWTEDGLVQRISPLFERLASAIAGRPSDDLPKFIADIAAQQVLAEQARDPNISKDQATRDAVVLHLRFASEYLRMQFTGDLDAGKKLRICRMIDDIAQSQIYIEGNVNVNLVLEHISNRLR